MKGGLAYIVVIWLALVYVVNGEYQYSSAELHTPSGWGLNRYPHVFFI